MKSTLDTNFLKLPDCAPGTLFWRPDLDGGRFGIALEPGPDAKTRPVILFERATSRWERPRLIGLNIDNEVLSFGLDWLLDPQISLGGGGEEGSTGSPDTHLVLGLDGLLFRCAVGEGGGTTRYVSSEHWTPQKHGTEPAQGYIKIQSFSIYASEGAMTRGEKALIAV